MRTIVLALLALLLISCDKAKPGYEQCTTLRANGDVLGAASACSSAVAASPDSKNGKAAAAALTEMDPDVKKAKAAADAKKAEADWKARFDKWSAVSVMAQWKRDGLVECPWEKTGTYERWTDTNGQEVMANAPHYLDLAKCASCSADSCRGTFGIFLWALKSQAELDQMKSDDSQAGKPGIAKDNLYLQIASQNDATRKKYEDALGRLVPPKFGP